MKKFPGEIKCVGQGHRKVLDEEQVAWLRRYYPMTENGRLADAMGIGRNRLIAFAKEYGLSKSEKGKKAIKRRQVVKMLATNIKNGCYDRKRGHPCSEATMAGVRRRWQEEKAGLRENAQKRIRREEPERYQRWAEKCSVGRKEMIRKEKLRVIYGLERKTSLIAVVLMPYKRSQIAHRYNALKRGYILTEDCSEGSPDRYVIYYDRKTKRNEEFERNCIQDGFRICEWV